MSLESSIAFRYMRARRKENFISLIAVFSIGGVGLGVAALIVVLAVLAGFESNLKDRFLSVTSHVIIMNMGGGIRDWPEKVEKLKAIEGVKSAEPFVYGQVFARGPGGESGMMVKGIDPALAASDGQLSKVGLTEQALSQLANPTELTEPPIILGRELSTRMHVYSYDYLNIVSFGRITPLGNRSIFRRTYQSAGTFKSGIYEYDSNLAYVTIEEAQKLVGLDGEISTIELMIDDIYKAPAILDKALNALDSDTYWGHHWMQRNANLFAALKLEQAAMFVVLTLIIVVAAFNIISTLIMMVKEKTRDIAILKSMGATSRQIRRIFTIQGLTVGLIGAFGGLVTGVSLCLLLKKYKFIELPPDVYMMDTLPVEMRAVHVVTTVVVTVLISYLATIYPAGKAARLDPVEALRYE
ncbi:ABC transporter permease [Deltaproteobacteria bacterium OttesenSCG-928-K17]|nr:ABC transporter permease [Deltaproteobacteria bacterium OttesenSCG-928-K17]